MCQIFNEDTRGSESINKNTQYGIFAGSLNFQQ